MTAKLQHFVAGGWEPFHHANTFAREKTTGPERLRIGPRGGHRLLFETLAAEAGPPHKLLYVLHTTRTGAALGRYESPWLEPRDLKVFLDRFAEFIIRDARHDLWVLCAATKSTIVWERHDLMYAYGSLEQFVILLEHGGLREGWPAPPVPHAHCYNEEWDNAEREILTYFDWHRTDLRAGDLQVIEDE